MMNYLSTATNSMTSSPVEEGIVFFGTFPVLVSKVMRFIAPASLSEQVSLESITEEEAEAEDEVCYYLTPKGMDGKTFVLPSKTRCTKRRTSKKVTRVSHATVALVSKKITL